MANTATVAARSLREEAYLAAERARQAKRVMRPGRPANRADSRPAWSVQSTIGMRLISHPTALSRSAESDGVGDCRPAGVVVEIDEENVIAVAELGRDPLHP